MMSERDLLESDLRGQTRVLKRLAQGASLDEVLHTLVEVAEESRPEMIGSIMLIEAETGMLRLAASRRLPDPYCEAVDRRIPGPRCGSCGTAAFTGQRVVVEEIATDPLWHGFRDIPEQAGLRACWSEPIIASTGEILGTFAMYYAVPRSPCASELEFVSSIASLAALAIERVRYQSEVERERAVLKTIVNGIPDALLMTDLDRKITHFSRGACRMFEYLVEEVLDESTSILYADHADFDRMARERFHAGAEERLDVTEIPWRRKSGSTFVGEMVGKVIRDEREKPLGFLALIRDVTDRKRAEACLAESRDKLVQAERLAAMGKMVSAIAHESRNALQRIQVGVDVLEYDIEPGSEARDDLDRIRRAKNDLQQLHDELRSFAGPIQLDPSTANLAEVWRQAWSNLHVLHQGRDVQLIEAVEDTDLLCELDVFRIEQVFRNLFENSLAACTDPVRITVACRLRNDDGRRVLCVSVRDNGPGLPAELRARVFEAFYTTKAKGTGLGMAIAERFITAHRGTIEAIDFPGGAEFLMTLPQRRS
ncbi:Sensor protein FixL [Rosistilla carotiformis]|uniref:histidine kinase n=1 Tax=Rosistilla carotiformis TaxID=2528017 RepID=A0A518JUQ4_9BACT|nr:GAF domain-containing protein [Rosistilla carotiformis]QDV69216.1 Sensor protein FixL [Rosistilla carotiformis]